MHTATTTTLVSIQSFIAIILQRVQVVQRPTEVQTPPLPYPYLPPFDRLGGDPLPTRHGVSGTIFQTSALSPVSIILF
jgi:hypothetical protein